jgi:hypothetical protein
MLRAWVLSKLEPVKDHKRVLVRDPARLISEHDGSVHVFAKENGFSVIVASTNLVFRELYEQAAADRSIKKILVVDRAPARWHERAPTAKAPPPLYPDLFGLTKEEGRIHLDLRDFLIQQTGDSNWPMRVNDPKYTRLIAKNLPGVMKAHKNLRVAHATRFTDHDFETVCAYAALGVADAAFKSQDPAGLWKLGLHGHGALAEVESIAPEVMTTIRRDLRAAPAPFCWFADRDPETVMRAFYLAVIVSQHTSNWKLLIANLDPSLAQYTDIDEGTLKEATPKLVKLGERQADRDLSDVEASLSKDALNLLLLDQMKLAEPDGFVAALKNEKFSTLIRGLSLLVALDNLLSAKPAKSRHKELAALLYPDDSAAELAFVESRQSVAWSHLKEAYQLATEVQAIRGELSTFVRKLEVAKLADMSWKFFLDEWNGKRLNRLEYYLSALERLVDSADLLPRPADTLPSQFGNTLDRIRDRVRSIAAETSKQLEDVNRRFQEMVVSSYPQWISRDADIYFTSQFIRRCLKAHWDPQTERAVVLIFDGMRYDIWDEMLRPMLADRMELIADLPGSAILPTETHVSRWAISAGTEPANFWPGRAENKHLQEALAHELNLTCEVQAVAPGGAGTGETVRYQAPNLDVYIFEFCDKELHKITVKKLPDGRDVPSRPLAFIYRQHLKSLIDNEIMAIVRNLPSNTKVFITADHGFGPVHRNPLQVDEAWLNEKTDCMYLNAWLREPLGKLKPPDKVRNNVWEIAISALRMPESERVRNPHSGGDWEKKYASVIFPKTGYALARPRANFNPDAYTHGGISLQEMVIPMVVLRVRPPEDGPLVLEQIEGPAELVEGEEVQFRIHLSRRQSGTFGFDELRVDLDATIVPDHPVETESVSRDLPHQVIYVPPAGTDAVFTYRLASDEATDEERTAGTLSRTLTITATFRDGRRTLRKSGTHRLVVQLKSDQVIRRGIGNLGNILGLTPKGSR